MIFLDTHVVVWLFAKERSGFSQSALDYVESNELAISPIVELEVEYLFETNRITTHAPEIIDYLSRTIQLQVEELDFKAIARRATGLKWTRDPFDRIITAHADYCDAKLLTKDRRIHEHYPHAVW